MHHSVLIKKQLGKLVLEAPHNVEFKAAIKFVLPNKTWKYYPTEHLWSFDPEYYQAVRFLVDHYYDAYQIFDQAFDEYLLLPDSPIDYDGKFTQFLYEWMTGAADREEPETNNRKTPYRILGLHKSAPEFIVTACWKAWNKQLRSEDELGTDQLKQINAAYDEIKRSW